MTDGLELSPDELIALAASARLVMRADGRISEGESEIAAQFGATVGLTPGEWNAVWDQAASQLPNMETVSQAVSELEREDARLAIYELLYKLAEDEEIVDAEWDVLEWLDEVWRAHPASVPPS